MHAHGTTVASPGLSCILCGPLPPNPYSLQCDNSNNRNKSCLCIINPYSIPAVTISTFHGLPHTTNNSIRRILLELFPEKGEGRRGFATWKHLVKSKDPMVVITGFATGI